MGILSGLTKSIEHTSISDKAYLGPKLPRASSLPLHSRVQPLKPPAIGPQVRNASCWLNFPQAIRILTQDVYGKCP